MNIQLIPFADSMPLNPSKIDLSRFSVTPHQYVVNCRINAARHALDTGDSLNDVVYRYGFADLSHFNRRFKRIYGMTPRQYQASIAS